MKITFYGHATVMVEVGETSILFDPFITPNPKASGIDINTLKPDYILLSHGHADHVADAAAIAQNSGATLVANFEVVNWFTAQGVEKTHPMNHGGKWKFDFGTVKMTNAVHTSSMPDGSYGGNPAGFVVDTQEGAFYFSGDTALTYDMKLVADEYDLKMAILPIGDNFTMGIDDAIRAAEFVNCKEILGIHFDTFGYIEIDHEAAKQKFSAAGNNLTLLGIGESAEY